MYFQSFGAVAIVKVNSGWFHVRERGVFGGIFGILISTGIFLAFDVSRWILEHLDEWWVFFLPAILLGVFFLIDLFVVRNRPADAGHPDFHLGDATADDGEERLPFFAVLLRMMTNPIIVTIALIEFCSGVLRQGIMHWFSIYAKQTAPGLEIFVIEHWGLCLAVAGAAGGVFASMTPARSTKSASWASRPVDARTRRSARIRP